MAIFKSKRKVIIFAVSVIVLLIGFFFYYFTSLSSYPTFAPIKEQLILTQEEYLEDFDYVYETLKNYYPYFDVNEKAHGINWLGNKEIYIDMISDCKTDKEFYDTMNLILADLHNGHTHIVDTKHGIEYYILYKKASPRYDWRVNMVKIFEEPRVQARYNVTNENINRILEAQDNYKPAENDYRNAIVGDVIPQEIGYISIKQMISPDLNSSSFKDEHDYIKGYLEGIKDYPALIIDIRENGGGNSRYWSNFLMPLIIDRPYSQSTYTFVKDGPLLSRYSKQSGLKKVTESIIEDFSFPKETMEMVSDFSYFSARRSRLVPNKDSINFKGKIYLIVDKNVYSSSEGFASFAKESNMATLVGERTGGDGIGSDPMFVGLPNSGFILRFSKEMGVTEKGSINELDQTEPDILISDPTKKISFGYKGLIICDEDKAITTIIEEERR